MFTVHYFCSDSSVILHNFLSIRIFRELFMGSDIFYFEKFSTWMNLTFAVCRFRLRANVNLHHVTKFSIDLSFILLSQLLVVPVVYTVTVEMTMAILMPPVWCILWKFVKPRYCSNVSKPKGAVERLFGICLRFQGHFTQRAFHTPVKHLNYHLFNLLNNYNWRSYRNRF